MLSWILTPSRAQLTASKDEQAAFSAAGTDFVEILIPTTSEKVKVDGGFRSTSREIVPQIPTYRTKHSQHADRGHPFYSGHQYQPSLHADPRKGESEEYILLDSQSEGSILKSSTYGTFAPWERMYRDSDCATKRPEIVCTRDMAQLSGTGSKCCSSGRGCEDSNGGRYDYRHHDADRPAEEESVPTVRRSFLDRRYSWSGRGPALRAAGESLLRQGEEAWSSQGPLEGEDRGGPGLVGGQALVPQGGEEGKSGRGEDRKGVVGGFHCGEKSRSWSWLGWTARIMAFDGPVNGLNDLDMAVGLGPSMLDGADDIPKRKPVANAGKVLDQIRVLEERQRGQATTTTVKRKPLATSTASPLPSDLHSKTSDGQSDVPSVFPLHVKRFSRRTSNATPMPRPETPLYRSTIPDGDEQAPIIHAPRAMRKSRILDHPAAPTTRAQGVRAAYTSPEGRHQKDSNATSQPTQLRQQLPQSPRQPQKIISPVVSFLQGTKEKCVRHGRRPGAHASPHPRALCSPQPGARYLRTNDGVERGRTGMYLPTGVAVRRQVDATSPWAASGPRGLNGVDACPDCVAELGIRRREIMRSQMQSGETAGSAVSSAQAPSYGDEPHGATTSMPVHLFTHGNRNPSHDNALVITEDLADSLEAAIFERGGIIERVILNRKLGPPTIEAMQKLSRDLLEVSRALASDTIEPDKPATLVLAGAAIKTQERAIVFEQTKTTGEGTRREYAVPELLDLVDNALESMRRQKDGKRKDLSRAEPDERKTMTNGVPGSVPCAKVIDHMVETTSHGLHGSSTVPKGSDVAVITATRPSNPPAAEKPLKEAVPSDSPAADFADAVSDPATITASNEPTKAISNPGPATASSNSIRTALATQSARGFLPSVATSMSNTIQHPVDTFKPITHDTNQVAAAAATGAKALMQQSPVPAIATNPTPYHHAPPVPRDLDVAQWADAKAQELRKARKALIGAGEVSLVQAAQAERTMRRQRAAVVGAVQGVL